MQTLGVRNVRKPGFKKDVRAGYETRAFERNKLSCQKRTVVRGHGHPVRKLRRVLPWRYAAKLCYFDS